MPDMSEYTHVNIRAPYRGGTRVHFRRYWPSSHIYATECGEFHRREDVTLTAVDPTCEKDGCRQKHERPVAVDMPPGPIHGVAAKTTSGLTVPETPSPIEPTVILFGG